MAVEELLAETSPELIRLAEKCDYENGHTWQVARLCGLLFDQLRELHHLGPEHKRYLICGALIHDIGWCRGAKGHHKTAYEILTTERPDSLLPQDAEVIGLIGRYHRKSLPSEQHAPYARLSDGDKEIVGKLSALLRVGDGLDRGHCSIVEDLQCEVAKKSVEIRIRSDGPAELEIWGALRKADLFKRVYERDVVIHRI